MNEENKSVFDEVKQQNENEGYKQPENTNDLDSKVYDDKQKTLNNSNSEEEKIKKELEDFEKGELPDEQEYLVGFTDDESVEVKTYKDPEGGEQKVKFSKNVFEIEDAKILSPITKDIDGNLVPPEESTSKKTGKTVKYYTSKVQVLYKNSSYKTLIPSVRWWVNGNKLNPSFKTDYIENYNPKFTSEITKLYWKFCDKYGYDKTKKDRDKILSPKQFLKELVGKKVILRELSGNYEGRDWTKLSIAEFKE
jgi:hypothetical protein